MSNTRIRPSLSKLRRSLEEIFPKECFLSGLSVKESQRVFSIKPTQGEAAIGIRIDHDDMDWPPGQPKCDALFVCFTPASDALAIVFVELKGNHVEKAFTQIIESVKAFCQMNSLVRDVHVQSVISDCRSLGKRGHGNRVLGVIVSNHGLAPKQMPRMRKWEHERIEIWIRAGQLSGLSCKQLSERLPPSK